MDLDTLAVTAFVTRDHVLASCLGSGRQRGPQPLLSDREVLPGGNPHSAENPPTSSRV